MALFRDSTRAVAWLVAGLFVLLLWPGSSLFAANRLGDINNDGVINILDVTLVMTYVLGLEELDATQAEAADVNNDGTVDVLDVNLMMQRSLGLIEFFPAELQGSALIETFIVAEGLTPGKKVVIVLLDAADPTDYTVKVGGEELSYNQAIRGFLGEVATGKARRSLVTVNNR